MVQTVDNLSTVPWIASILRSWMGGSNDLLDLSRIRPRLLDANLSGRNSDRGDHRISLEQAPRGRQSSNPTRGFRLRRRSDWPIAGIGSPTRLPYGCVWQGSILRQSGAI